MHTQKLIKLESSGKKLDTGLLMPERSAAPRAASESERRVKVKVVEIADGALTGGGIDEDAHLKFRMGNYVCRNPCPHM